MKVRSFACSIGLRCVIFFVRAFAAIKLNISKPSLEAEKTLQKIEDSVVATCRLTNTRAKKKHLVLDMFYFRQGLGKSFLFDAPPESN